MKREDAHTKDPTGIEKTNVKQGCCSYLLDIPSPHRRYNSGKQGEGCLFSGLLVLVLLVGCTITYICLKIGVCERPSLLAHWDELR